MKFLGKKPKATTKVALQDIPEKILTSWGSDLETGFALIHRHFYLPVKHVRGTVHQVVRSVQVIHLTTQTRKSKLHWERYTHIVKHTNSIIGKKSLSNFHHIELHVALLHFV